MITTVTLLIVMAAGAVAGTLGALLGIGGGVFLVPFLNVGLGLPIKEAGAVSLMTVIATSVASRSEAPSPGSPTPRSIARLPSSRR